MLKYFKELLVSEEGSAGGDLVMLLAVFAIMLQGLLRFLKKSWEWCDREYKREQLEKLRSGSYEE